MSGFLYFLPGEQNYRPAQLVEYGLTHIVDAGDTILHRQVVRGPENRPGVVIGARASWSDADVKWSDGLRHRPFPAMYADKQALCCWVDGELPGPADLARAKQLVGQHLTLADGNAWLIPHARQYSNGMYRETTPRTIDVDDQTGEFISGEVIPQYQAIWNHAEQYMKLMLATAEEIEDGEFRDIEFHHPLQLIVDSIAANYRVSARELGVLQIVDDQMYHAVASVLVDLAGMAQIQKKTGSDTGNG